MIAEHAAIEVKQGQNLQAEIDNLRIRLDLLSKATSDGLWDMEVVRGDPTNPANPFWWSDQFKKLLGYQDDHDFPAVLGSWSNLLHPDDKQRTLNALHAHLADRSGKTPYDVVYMLATKSNGYRWFRARGETLRDAEGMPLRVAGVLSDITDQRATEIEKERAMTRFDLVREMLTDGIWDMEVINGDPVNPNNPFWWSQQFRRLLGYETAEEFPDILDSWASRLHPEDKDRVLKVFGDYLTNRGGALYDIEYRLQCRDGEYRWFRARGQMRRDANGMPLRVVGGLSDITARRREEEYRLAEAEHAKAAHISHQLVENTSEGVLLLGGDLAIISANKAVSVLTGQPVAGLPGRSLRTLLAQDAVSAEQINLVRSALATKGHWTGELEMRSADGTAFPAQFSLDTIAGHENERYSCVFVDISDRKQAEEQRAARERAENATTAKSLFLANISHEIRTPMNAILGFARLMQRDGNLTVAQREKLDIIAKSGDHLLGLINDVLDMSAIESGSMRLNVAPMDLGAMIRETISMMRERAETKNLQLRAYQSFDVPQYIHGDEGKLRQVLINFLSNAIKFSTSGQIDLRVAIAPAVEGSNLLIEVEDHGRGIDAEDLERIFEPFVQSGHQTTYKGTGLGLAIARQYVHLMGGNIAVESVLGKGSLFKIALPLSIAASEQVQEEIADKGEVLRLAPGQPLYRILVVEDIAESALLLTCLLENVGFSVEVAEDGAKGVEAFERGHPHFIWMDRRMPVMDGIEACREIRSRAGGNAVKIVGLTASALLNEVDILLAAGMDDVVRKPYRPEQIYDCLAKWLGVQYLYRESSPSNHAVHGNSQLPAQLLALPQHLRNDLKQAVFSFDAEKVNGVISAISQRDAELAAILRTVIDNSNHSLILRALKVDADGN